MFSGRSMGTDVRFLEVQSTSLGLILQHFEQSLEFSVTATHPRTSDVTTTYRHDAMAELPVSRME